MIDPKRVVASPLPAPAEKYDRTNEAAFRSALERQLRELAEAVRILAANQVTP